MKGNNRVIIIDSQEAAVCPRIAELLRNKFELSVQPLKSADYVLSSIGKMKGSIGIERKTISDLASSVIDGRLWSQVDKLCRTYEYPVLLIEGSLYPLSHNPMLWGVYIKLIYSFRKLKVAHSRDEKGSSVFIKHSATYIGPTGSKPPLVRERKITPGDIRVAMLCTVKGIGMKTSKRLLKEVPDLFCNRYTRKSLVKKLSSVTGVGKTMATRIARVFVEKHK